MAANEVNDIVIRLMAVADRIGGRERDDLMHYAGRLSRAATRERNAAVDEIQRLRKKIVQQGAELRRLDNLVKSAQEPFAPQPPLAGGHGRFDESRVRALDRGSTPNLDYGAGYGRLSRPEGLPQPMRRATSATPTTTLDGEQRPTSADVSFSQCQSHPVQDQPGYGLFNPARFLALQSDAPTTPLPFPGTGNERSSLSDGPPPPRYAVTAANAEPVAPRGAKRGVEPAERHFSAKQAADQLLDEIGKSQNEATGSKRRASDDDTITPTVKRQATAPAVPSTGAHSNTIALNGYSTMPSSDDLQAVQELQRFFEGRAAGRAMRVVQDNGTYPSELPNTSHATQYYLPQPPQEPSVRIGSPTCTHCFKESWKCDGRAHCGQCNSNKCLYVLCNPETCLGATCVKIHSSQYDFAARKPGQARRLVLGDNLQIPALKMSRDERTALYSLVNRMGQRTRSMPAAGISTHTPAPTASLVRLPLAGLPLLSHGAREDLHSTSVEITGNGEDEEDSYPFRVPKAVREAASRSSLPLTSEPARPGSPDDSSRIKVEAGGH